MGHVLPSLAWGHPQAHHSPDRSATQPPNGLVRSGAIALPGVANFLERRYAEVRRTSLLSSRANEGGEGLRCIPLDDHGEAVAEAEAEAVVAGTAFSGPRTVFSIVFSGPRTVSSILTVRAGGVGGAACSRPPPMRPRKNPRSSPTSSPTASVSTNALAGPALLLLAGPVLLLPMTPSCPFPRSVTSPSA